MLLAFAFSICHAVFQRAAKKAKKGGDEEEGGDSALALMDLPMSFGKKKK
jgi:hypothetical protein